MAVEIGGVAVANPLFLAPLAGVTNRAVRRLFVRMGVGLTHTEMVSSQGLIRSGAKTQRLLEDTAEEHPLVVQLFSGDPDSLERSAVEALEGHRYEAISINMACPMPKVTKRGAGAKLLESPAVAAEMVRRLKKLGLPVWPKIRKIAPSHRYGLNTKQFVEALLEAGAHCVAIHGRSPAQRYEGEADAEEVLNCARAFPGRIIASGDVYSPDRVRHYLKGGAVAVLLARGAIADPFLPQRALAVLGYNTPGFDEEPSLSQRAEALLTFADELQELQGPQIAAVMVRRFLPGFFRGMEGITEFKRAVAAAQRWEDLEETLGRWRSYFERGSK